MALRLGGITSGMDTDSLMFQLMAVERRPVTLLNRQKDTFQTRLDAWTEIRSRLDALQPRLKDLKAASSFTARSAAVGDSALFTASADSTAAVGTYQIEVVQMAAHKIFQGTPASVVSDPNAALGVGQLQVVARDAGGASVTKTIDLDGTKSLQAVANEINAWTDTQLKARVAQIRSGEYELVVEETRTGSAYDFTISQTAGSVFNGFAVTQAAQDAVVKVDSLQYQRSANTISDVIAGVTLNLKKIGGPTSLDVTRDTQKAYDTIKALVEAYNGLTDAVAKHSAYDAVKKARGPLLADSALSGMVSRIRSTLAGVVSAAAQEANSLAMIGIKTEYKTGHLVIDETELKDKLADFGSDIQTLFQDASQGLAVLAEGVVQDYTGSAGLIAQSQETLTKNLDRIADKVTFFEQVILPQKEKRLRQQFTRMEQMMAQFQGQGAWLQSQLAAMGG